MSRNRPTTAFRPSLSAVLLFLLLATLWIAGGSARADESGQVIVRGAAVSLSIIAILFGTRVRLDFARPALYFLLAGAGLALLQLVPLPPALWQALPGREILSDAATISGRAQPWRPWAIVPSATFNAAASLIVPAATLFFTIGLDKRERAWLPSCILVLIGAAALLALTQISGGGFDNPFINDEPGDVSGIFANRNHFALFLAFGLLLAPIWAFPDKRKLSWRGAVAISLILFFSLTILATGSRTGIILGLLALAIGLAIAKENIRHALHRYPRWVFPSLIIAIAGIIAMFVLISFLADRAESINRLLTISPEQDARSRSLPTIFSMIRTYFPMGYGFGGFDPMFRISEPITLLDYSYLNHAHNDILEIILEAGLPGLILLVSALFWWGLASIRAWRGNSDRILSRLGSAMIFLIFTASAFDYPARTPMIMAMTVLAALWLNEQKKDQHASS